MKVKQIFNRETGKPATVQKLRKLFQRLNSKISEEESFGALRPKQISVANNEQEYETEEDEMKLDELMFKPSPESKVELKVSEEVEVNSSSNGSNKKPKLNWSESEKDSFLRIIKELDGGNVSFKHLIL